MILALRVLLPFSLAYLIAYLLRVVNAVAGDPLRMELGLSTSELGLLTSLYFLGFALFQLPFGILMDRYGPRRVEAILLLLAALGCVIFAVATDFAELLFGRIMMGIGAAMCLMAPFTAYRRWFSPERVPLVVGIHMSFGAIGASLGGGPTEWLLGITGWRAMFGLLAGLVVVVSAMIFFVVPRRNDPVGTVPMKTLAIEVGAILKSPAMWRIAPLSATSQAGMLAIVSLWTGPWLREAAGHDSATAAMWLSITSIGLLIGYLGFGFITGRAERSGHAVHVFVAGSFAFALVELLIIVLPPQTATPLWILYTITGSAGVLSYGIATQSFPNAMAGRVNTTVNFIVFFFAFLVQWGFGIVLDFFPNGAGGATRAGYQVALSILLVLQLLAIVPLLVVRNVRTPDWSVR
ncbi:MFS transporter [Acuticoccus sp. M5D2P5]|uniref:MFS transporter n=1 Tax=Acuticoccus kalidii TaxID=2910977 RepID=UPI001F1CE3D7|nr:MFS transporter [Acuticoccus kalidii]MCF3932578.1 MFS transporter [Acuticoccus kalidii]